MLSRRSGTTTADSTHLRWFQMNPLLFCSLGGRFFFSGRKETIFFPPPRLQMSKILLGQHKTILLLIDLCLQRRHTQSLSSMSSQQTALKEIKSAAQGLRIEKEKKKVPFSVGFFSFLSFVDCEIFDLWPFEHSSSSSSYFSTRGSLSCLQVETKASSLC